VDPLPAGGHHHRVPPEPADGSERRFRASTEKGTWAPSPTLPYGLVNLTNDGWFGDSQKGAGT